MKEPILNKSIYYRRWLSGEFGNRPMAWSNLKDLEKSSYVGPVNIRHIIPGSPHVKLGIPKSQCRKIINESGVPENEFKFNEPMPDDTLIIQGEVMEDHRGLWLTYSKEKASMRVAMQNPLHCRGLSAKMLLQQACDSSSYDWIRALLDDFPSHVVEFSVFRSKVGNLQNNTIIWEVRAY